MSNTGNMFHLEVKPRNLKTTYIYKSEDVLSTRSLLSDTAIHVLNPKIIISHSCIAPKSQNRR